LVFLLSLAFFDLLPFAMGLAVMAMGMMNTSHSGKDGVVLGLTHLTGAVVKVHAKPIYGSGAILRPVPGPI
jgi:uncharacterized membrane protein YoaK (UPF0700 family)